jgi:hypothetical protein
MKHYLAIVLAILAFTGCSKGQVEQSPTTTKFSIAYTTELEAATVAIALSEQSSEVVEYAGAIFKLDGLYYFTIPQTSNSYDSFEGTIHYPIASTLIGMYHTHPPTGRDPAAVFSSADVKMGDDNNIKMYLGVMMTNQIRVYVPGKSKTDQHSVLGKISYGEVVGSY